MEGLEDEADFLGPEAGPLVLAQGAQLLSLNMDGPAAGPVQSREKSEQSSLAAARGSQDRQELAGRQTEGDILQDSEIALPGAICPGERLATQHSVRHCGMILRPLLLSGCLTALAACDRPRDDLPEGPPASSQPTESPTILFLGTSLTAGYGLDPEQAYPALIQERIDAAGLGYRVINAGVSGETSAGARRRVEWLFQQPVSVLVLETGANDGLRGLPPDSLRANIQAIFDQARRLRPSVALVLLGMRMPPNYGRAYTRQFESVYPELARSNQATLVPFLLEGVGGVNALNQPDGIHPTAEGQRRLAETVWRVLEPVLRGTERTARAGR